MIAGPIGYLKQLSEVMLSAEATSRSGDPLTLYEAFDAALELTRGVESLGRKIMLVGNGGSAAIASHMQNDLCKAAEIRALVFTEQPLLTALSNDESYVSAYEISTRLWVERGDLLIAISSSGQSENILRACQAASEAEVQIVTFSGFSETNPLRSLGAVNFYVRSDSYGLVETAHAALGHYFTDALAGMGEPADRPDTKRS